MTPDHAVRRTTDSALWEQVSEALRTDLLAGTFGGGQKLASEATLATRFGVSRMTLRQALAHLEVLGLVHPRAGRGWFVGAPQSGTAVSEDPGALQSFTEMARSRGLTPDSVVLHCRVRPADWEEAEQLAVAPGADLLSLRRLRRLDGIAVAVDHSLVPASLLVDASADQFRAGSLYAALQRGGVRPVRADYEVQAVAADADHADLLDVHVGAPLLSARQICTDTSGRPIERGHITYRGDRYRFRAVLQA